MLIKCVEFMLDFENGNGVNIMLVLWYYNFFLWEYN